MHTCFLDFAREWAHMQTHKRPRIKRFQCDQCEKMFENRGALNVHAFTHSDDKPYVCNECGKAFKRLDRLDIHKSSNFYNTHIYVHSFPSVVRSKFIFIFSEKYTPTLKNIYANFVPESFACKKI